MHFLNNPQEQMIRTHCAGLLAWLSFGMLFARVELLLKHEVNKIKLIFD
jgi:hypothetical protein